MKPAEFLKKSERYFEQLKKAKQMQVKVGLVAGEATSKVYESGETVLQVGAKHEFGDGNPVRSFLRVPFESHADEIKAKINEQFKAVLEQGRDVEVGLGRVGLTAQNISREAFETGGWGEWPDISQATKDAKGSDKILVHRGILAGSITYEVANA